MRDMLGRKEAIPVQEAQKLISEHFTAKEPGCTIVPIDEAYQRVLAHDISSPEDLPAFPRSTVDGFAVNSGDTFGATEGLPAYLIIQHNILMGEEPAFALKKGNVAGIPTGGMLPEGADAVVMLEHTQGIDDSTIEVLKPVAPKENVINTGEDMRKGEVMLKKGKKLRPQDIAALAAVGIISVSVYDKPRVSIISTGDEIVEADRPLSPGQVRDVNSYNLAGLILEHGGIPLRKGIFRDVYEDIIDVVRESLNDSSMVIVTGGSSVGAKDMTSKIIDDLGFPGVVFHGVALKPGKPTIFGVVNDIPVFGLPGHPAAVTVCFNLFVEPVLGSLAGIQEEEDIKKKTVVKARMSKNISSGIGREEHVRVALEKKGDELWAIPVLGKSGLVRTLVMAEGTVIVPSHIRGVEEGDTVDVILF